MRPASLQLRFMLVVVTGAVLFAALAAGIAYGLTQERALANAQATLEGMALSIEKTMAIGAYTSDSVLLGEIADGLVRNAIVARVELRSPRGEPMLVRTAAGRRPEPGGLRIERPLVSPFDASETVGVLRIEADMPLLKAAARRDAAAWAALMIGQAVLLALLLYAAAAVLVSQPIERLAAALRAMRPGTGERLVMPPRHAHDEIGTLIESGNALLAANETALQRERDLRGEIEQMEAQYRQIFDASSAGIFVLDANGRLINHNRTVLRLIGLSMTEMQMLREHDFLLQVFAQPEAVREMIDEAAERREIVAADVDLLRHGGSAHWVHLLISVQTAGPGRERMVEGVMYDITERRRAETTVRHLAEHDALTGLKNRAASEALIDRFLADAGNSDAQVTLLCVDLDGFKQVNDAFGHAAGDQVLVSCARRMQAAVRRSSDLVGRIGGDEFIVALYNIGPHDGALGFTAQALLDTLCEPVLLDDGRTARIGASVGIACFPRHGQERRALLHAADQAMYEVKRTGKNAFAVAL